MFVGLLLTVINALSLNKTNFFVVTKHENTLIIIVGKITVCVIRSLRSVIFRFVMNFPVSKVVHLRLCHLIVSENKELHCCLVHPRHTPCGLLILRK